MNKVMMIFLDAFSSRYLSPEDTPFLSGVSQRGFCAPLNPLFAFAGIGAALFTGTSVNTNKRWCDYVLKEDGSGSSRLFKMLLWLCDRLPSDTANQYARYAAYRSLGRDPGTPNLIPIALLDRFELKQKQRLTEENPLGEIPTLFDQLRKNEVEYAVHGLYESVFEKQILARAADSSKKGCQLVLFKLGALDRIGHKYGPESARIRRKLAEIDGAIKETVERELALNPETHFVIFSDHGMTPVQGSIDLLGVLEKLPLRMPADYMVFLNSTVAGLWFSSQTAKDLVTKELDKIDSGFILDDTSLRELEIDSIGPENGHLLFALKEHHVFFPDFYRRRNAPKGMHGYAFCTYDTPVLMIHSPRVSGRLSPDAPVNHIDIMPTVLDLLNLPIPTSCEGTSIAVDLGL